VWIHNQRGWRAEPLGISALCDFKWVTNAKAPRLSQRGRTVSPRRTRRARRSQRTKRLITLLGWKCSNRFCLMGSHKFALKFIHSTVFNLLARFDSLLNSILRVLRGEFSSTSGLAPQLASILCASNPERPTHPLLCASPAQAGETTRNRCFILPVVARLARAVGRTLRREQQHRESR